MAEKKDRARSYSPAMWSSLEDVTNSATFNEGEIWEEDFTYEGDTPTQEAAIKGPGEKLRFNKKIKRRLIIAGSGSVICICIVFLLFKMFSFDSRYIKSITSSSNSVLTLSSNYDIQTPQCVEADRAKEFIKELKLKPTKEIHEDSYNEVCFNFNWGESKSISFYDTPDFTTVKLMDHQTPKYYQTNEQIYNQANDFYTNAKNFFISFYNTTLGPLITYNRQNQYTLEGNNFNSIDMVNYCLKTASNIKKLLPEGASVPEDGNSIVEISFDSLQPLMEKHFGVSLSQWNGPQYSWGIAADVKEKKIRVKAECLTTQEYQSVTGLIPEYSVRANGDIEATLNWENTDNGAGTQIVKEKYLMQKNGDAGYALKQVTCQRNKENASVGTPVKPLSTVSFQSDQLKNWRDSNILYKSYHLFLQCESIDTAKIMGINITTGEMTEGGIVNYSVGGNFSIIEGQLFYHSAAAIYKIDENLQAEKMLDIPVKVYTSAEILSPPDNILYSFTPGMDKILYRDKSSNRFYIYNSANNECMPFGHVSEGNVSKNASFATEEGWIWLEQYNEYADIFSFYNVDGTDVLFKIIGNMCDFNGSRAIVHGIYRDFNEMDPQEQRGYFVINAHTGEIREIKPQMNTDSTLNRFYINDKLLGGQGLVYAQLTDSQGKRKCITMDLDGRQQAEIITDFSGDIYVQTPSDSSNGLAINSEGEAVLIYRQNAGSITYTLCG